jgi:hypothetical protein
MTRFFRSATLALTAFTGLSVHAQSSASDYQIDYAPLMLRGFGISDEPSMLNQCGANYGGIRVFEHAAGRPIALVRVEKIEGGAQITERTFENGSGSGIAQANISEAEWAEFIGLIEKSGFWNYEMDDSVWVPDSPTMWIEACLAGQFRSISLHPERTDLAIDIVDFLSNITR